MLLMGLMTFIKSKRNREERERNEREANARLEGGDDQTDGEGTEGTGREGSENGADGTTEGGGAGTDQGTPGDTSGNGDVTQGAQKLTTEEFDEIMRNKDNVTAELKKHGVTAAKDDKADKLREDLKAILSEKGMLPDGD